MRGVSDCDAAKLRGVLHELGAAAGVLQFRKSQARE